MLLYTVKKGDSLYQISERYRIPIKLLSEINAIENPDALLVGQSLILAKPTSVHTVTQGETVYSIAREYHVSVSELLRNNPSIIDNTPLSVGQELVIRYEGESDKPILVNGYTYPFINRSTLQKTLPYLSTIALFSYGFTSEGDLVTNSDNALIENAKMQGVNPVLVLSSLNDQGKFDNSLSHNLLNDPALQDYLIANIISTMALKGTRILNVDFQFLFPEDQALYTEFLHKLQKAFAPYRYKLWVSVSPKKSAGQKGLLYEGQNYRSIGEIADKVLLMTFEWGYQYNPQLSLIPYNELKEVLAYAKTEIPPQKILLGVPNYAYEIKLPYTHDHAEKQVISIETAVDIARQKKVEILFDDKTKSAFFEYVSVGIKHRVCFEDARSIQAILDLVQENDLAGISIWNIMNYYLPTYFLLNSYKVE